MQDALTSPPDAASSLPGTAPPGPQTTTGTNGGPIGNSGNPGSPIWQLRLLGGFELSDGTQRLTRLQSRPVMALLARLALQPDRAHAREALIDQLWPDVGLDIGRNRLRQALSTLRATLEPPGAAPVLIADRRTVRLITSALDCDAVRFERLLQQGQPARAAALYRGELLPGFYDGWINDERSRLAALAEQTLASGPAPRRRDVLPRYLTRLLGSDAIGARLQAEVSAHRLVTLVGPGGSGKTRLAVEVAQAALDGVAWGLGGPGQSHGFEWVEFVSLVACTSREAMLDTVLLALRLDPARGDALAALVDALAGRRALVVLDNFEQLVEPCAGLVATLASRLPQVHWLVTSRRTLGLDGERDCAMPPLPLPLARASLADLPRNPAVALFLDRARAVRSDFRPDAPQMADISALVGVLDGLPLAIELAAARMRSLSTAQILALLRAPAGTPLALLERSGPRAGQDQRHASMLGVLAWSWALLPAPAQQLLAALSVFAGAFSAEAAAQVCGPDGDAGQGQVLLALDDLVMHSLLRPHDSAGHFIMSGLIREYAAQQLDPARARRLRARHRQWLIAWAGALPISPALREVRSALPNLALAFASADADATPQDAATLFDALQNALGDITLPPGALAALVRCVAALAPSPQRALTQASLARALFRAGDAGQARNLAAAALADLATDPTIDPPRQQALRAQVLARIAHLRWRLDRDPEVISWLAEALAIAQAQQMHGVQASVLSIQGAIARPSDPARAAALQRQAIAAWLAAGDAHGVNTGRHNLALALSARPETREAALVELRQMLADARAAEDWVQVAFGANQMGEALRGLRRWHEAATAYREGVSVSHGALEVLPLAYCLWNLPIALAHLRRPQAAATLMGFAAAFWVRRFGPLLAHDARELQRVLRLASAQAGRAQTQAWLAQGQGLTLGDAVALALGPGA